MTDSIATPTSGSSAGIRFFSLLPGLEHVEIDPDADFRYGPSRARPWRPIAPSAPRGTNMIYAGILMGQPQKVIKAAKRKSNDKWTERSRIGNDVFLRMDKDNNTKLVDSGGTVVAQRDVRFRRGYSKDDATNELKRSQTEWKSKFKEELRVLQEQYMAELKVWQQEFYDNLVDDGTLVAPTNSEVQKRKSEEEHEMVMKAKTFLEGVGYTVVGPALLDA